MNACEVHYEYVRIITKGCHPAVEDYTLTLRACVRVINAYYYALLRIYKNEYDAYYEYIRIMMNYTNHYGIQQV
jgi:hypothetical protein